jgi:hypothetical protein
MRHDDDLHTTGVHERQLPEIKHNHGSIRHLGPLKLALDRLHRRKIKRPRQRNSEDLVGRAAWV